MSKNMSRVVPFLGALGLLTQAVPANAQGWGNQCCNPCPTCCAVQTCMQPVSVPCYRQVPVTHYEPYEQTVMKPICRTEYIEQPITVCKPVCEQRVAEVPECTYHPVTEFYPQTRRHGRLPDLLPLLPADVSLPVRFKPRPLRLAEPDRLRDADGLHAAIHVRAPLGAECYYHASPRNPPGCRTERASRDLQRDSHAD